MIKVQQLPATRCPDRHLRQYIVGKKAPIAVKLASQWCTNLVSNMTYFIIKCVLSGIIIALVSEVAKRSPALGALVVSLPLISLLAIIWLWRDTADVERIAGHAETTFWYVLPSLPMFLVLPMLLRAGVGFWLSLALCCVLTVVLYLITVWALSKFGLHI